jgi:hypothetical protein
MKGKQAVIRARRAHRARPHPRRFAARATAARGVLGIPRARFCRRDHARNRNTSPGLKANLYALFDSKQTMLATCITERAGGMRHPLNLASQVPESREALEVTVVQFGKSILHGLSDPDVLAVYRLAIAESTRAPDIARILDKAGREANHLALGAWLAKAQVARAGRCRQPGLACDSISPAVGASHPQQQLDQQPAPRVARNWVGARRERIANLLYPPPRRGD